MNQKAVISILMSALRRFCIAGLLLSSIWYIAPALQASEWRIPVFGPVIHRDAAGTVVHKRYVAAGMATIRIQPDAAYINNDVLGILNALHQSKEICMTTEWEYRQNLGIFVANSVISLGPTRARLDLMQAWLNSLDNDRRSRIFSGATEADAIWRAYENGCPLFVLSQLSAESARMVFAELYTLSGNTSPSFPGQRRTYRFFELKHGTMFTQDWDADIAQWFDYALYNTAHGDLDIPQHVIRIYHAGVSAGNVSVGGVNIDVNNTGYTLEEKIASNEFDIYTTGIHRVIATPITYDYGVIVVERDGQQGAAGKYWFPDTTDGIVWKDSVSDMFRGHRRVYDAGKVQEVAVNGEQYVAGKFIRCNAEGEISFMVRASVLKPFGEIPQDAWFAWLKQWDGTSMSAESRLRNVIAAEFNNQMVKSTNSTAQVDDPNILMAYLSAATSGSGYTPKHGVNAAEETDMENTQAEERRGIRRALSQRQSGSYHATVGRDGMTRSSGDHGDGGLAGLWNDVKTGFSNIFSAWQGDDDGSEARDLASALSAMKRNMQINEQASEYEAALNRDDVLRQARPTHRPDYGRWSPGMPIVRPRQGEAAENIVDALVKVGNALSKYAEGGTERAVKSADYKKANMLPAGYLPSDVVPPWGYSDPLDPMLPDFPGRGDGDNPVVAKPHIIWRYCGLPFYDHDGDGDLDRFFSSDPYDNGYTHLRVRWKFKDKTFMIRTGITSALMSFAAQMGWRQFNPVSGEAGVRKHAAFSVAGMNIRPDGTVRREDILFWGNDTSIMFDHRKTKYKKVAKIKIPISYHWWFGPSLENMMVRANPGTSFEDPDSHNTWILRLMYCGTDRQNTTHTASQHVSTSAAGTEQKNEQKIWYRLVSGGETDDPNNPNIRITSFPDGTILQHKARVVYETSIWEHAQPVSSEDGSTAAYSRPGFVPLASPAPPACVVRYEVHEVFYGDDGVSITREERYTVYYPAFALQVTCLVYQDGDRVRTERVEELSIVEINSFDTDADDNHDSAAIGAITTNTPYGQWVDVNTGIALNGMPSEIRWLRYEHANPPWYHPRHPTTVSIYLGDHTPSNYGESETRIIDGVAVNIYRHVTDGPPSVPPSSKYRYEEKPQDRMSIEERQAQQPLGDRETWVWGVADFLPDINGDGRVTKEDEGVPLLRAMSWQGGGQGDTEGDLRDSFEKMRLHYENVFNSAYDIATFAQQYGSLNAANIVMLALFAPTVISVQLSNMFYEFIENYPSVASGIFGGFTVACIIGLLLSAAWVGPAITVVGIALAVMAVFKYIVGPLMSLTFLLVDAIRNGGKNPIQSVDNSWMPWYVKRQNRQIYGGGYVVINSQDVRQDSELAQALGIQDGVSLVTETGSALFNESGGIIEFIVRSDMNAYRQNASGWAVFLSQPMASSWYYDHGSFLATPPTHPVNVYADIDVTHGVERNISGDRIYAIDSGFGFYVLAGQVKRFFNEYEQARILRDLWMWDFMTPPSRKIVQLWNNGDPGSPLLNTAFPIRAIVRENPGDNQPLWSISSVASQGFFDSVVSGSASALTHQRLTVEDAMQRMGRGSDIAALLPITKRMYYDQVLQRRLTLKERPIVFIFSAFRGREWEKEMAKRMPQSARLMCVEWEDRNKVMEEFRAVGRTVEFVESPKYRMERGDRLDDAFYSGVESDFTEETLAAWIAHTFIGVQPFMVGKGDFGRAAALRTQNSDNIIACIKKIKEILQSAGKHDATVWSENGWKAWGASAFVTHDLTGRPAILLHRPGMQSVTTNAINEDHDGTLVGHATVQVQWPSQRQSIILISGNNTPRLNEQPRTWPRPSGVIDGPPQLTEPQAYALAYDLIEMRHPMIVYYNDDTSAVYVHYGLRCNPADIFPPEKWLEHRGITDGVIRTMTNSTEERRRRSFEQFVSSPGVLEALSKRINNNGYLAYAHFRGMQKPRDSIPAQQPLPEAPQAPQPPLLPPVHEPTSTITNITNNVHIPMWIAYQAPRVEQRALECYVHIPYVITKYNNIKTPYIVRTQQPSRHNELPQDADINQRLLNTLRQKGQINTNDLRDLVLEGFPERIAYPDGVLAYIRNITNGARRFSLLGRSNINDDTYEPCIVREQPIFTYSCRKNNPFRIETATTLSIKNHASVPLLVQLSYDTTDTYIRHTTGQCESFIDYYGKRHTVYYGAITSHHMAPFATHVVTNCTDQHRSLDRPNMTYDHDRGREVRCSLQITHYTGSATAHIYIYEPLDDRLRWYAGIEHLRQSALESHVGAINQTWSDYLQQIADRERVERTYREQESDYQRRYSEWLAETTRVIAANNLLEAERWYKERVYEPAKLEAEMHYAYAQYWTEQIRDAVAMDGVEWMYNSAPVPTTVASDNDIRTMAESGQHPVWQAYWWYITHASELDDVTTDAQNNGRQPIYETIQEIINKQSPYDPSSAP